MKTLRSTCPDCDTEMQPIKLIDATSKTAFGAAAHVELSYAAPDAQASAFIGTIPALGPVKGRICPECGRIVLYGANASSL